MPRNSNLTAAKKAKNDELYNRPFVMRGTCIKETDEETEVAPYVKSGGFLFE